MACCSCWTMIYFGVIGYILWRAWQWMRKGRITDLSNRHIFITGCDSGFGNAIAKRLDSLGVNVFAACYTENGESELARLSSSRLKTVRLDVSDYDSILEAYKFVESSLPSGKGLWAVLNNAGMIANLGPCDWHRSRDYHEIMKVNTYGHIDVTVTFLPLVKKERGRIVNTTSEQALLALPFTSCYASTKYAMEAFSDALRREVCHFGVGVHIIEPGAFRTKLLNAEAFGNILRSSWARAPDHVKKDYGLDYVDKLISITKDTMAKLKPDITPVVNAYEDALIGRYPRHRYVVGWDAFSKKIVQLLPECVSDKLIALAMKKIAKPAGAVN